MYSRYNIPQYGRNMQNYNRPRPPRPPYQGNNDRFFGGFLGPFLLGGIAGGAVAPYFWNRPNYYPPYPPYPTNYYYYGGYYR